MPIPASHYCDDPEVCEVCAPAPAVLEPVMFVCGKCRLPAARAAAGWVHTEPADAAFCALVFGTANPGE